jgi:hypothetical protein
MGKTEKYKDDIVQQIKEARTKDDDFLAGLMKDLFLHYATDCDRIKFFNLLGQQGIDREAVTPPDFIMRSFTRLDKNGKNIIKLLNIQAGFHY